MNTKKSTWEIQEAVEGSLLAVCPECGFEMDATQVVVDITPDPSVPSVTRDAAGRMSAVIKQPIEVGYECPRCVLRHFLDTRQAVIEATVARGAAQLKTGVHIEVARLRAVALAALAVYKNGTDLGVGAGSGAVHKLLGHALLCAGFSIGHNVYPLQDTVRPPHIVAGAVTLLREAFRNDGAEGESVHLVCDELERLGALGSGK